MQLFVKGLAGESHLLEFNGQETICEVREILGNRVGFRLGNKQITFLGRHVDDKSTLIQCNCQNGNTLHLTGALLGGKGGFGANLRGSAKGTKTTNFSACRDLNGQRLGVAEAADKIEAWQTQEEERRLQKVAEKHLREVEKEEERKGKAKIDIQHFRESLEETSGRVASAVRDGLLNANKLNAAKRKESSIGASTSKKAKTWNSFDDSDSDSDSEFIPDAPTEVKVQLIPETLKNRGNGVDKDNKNSIVPSVLSAEKEESQKKEGASAADGRVDDAMTLLRNSKSAEDLESLGLGRLKEALQKHGLKCGGTLTERASRLFMLKTLGKGKIDKKHLAKGSVTMKI